MKSFLLLLLVPIISQVQCDDRSRADTAVAELVKYYSDTDGLFAHQWWTGANAFTTMLDYMILTGSRQYVNHIETTFVKGRKKQGHDFTNEFIDDSGWWGLSWIRAYDVTKDTKYLKLAEEIADYMWGYHDNVCKGGLYWKNDKKYKSSISNELFVKLAASIHNRVGGDSKYLNQAKDIWNWLKNSGVINKDHHVEDGINLPSCKSHDWVFSYNQGVIIGGLVELHKATKDQAYLNEAKTLADAFTKSSSHNTNGILNEGGEACNNDGASFKGAFVRNLGELSRALPNHPYHAYLEKNADYVYNHARNNNNQYGNKWLGPYKETSVSCQHSAADLMIAALKS